MIVIASSSTDCLSRWKQGLYGLDAVLEVSDMRELKRGLERNVPRYLLLDLEFPGLGGAATVRKLRQISPTTKIILLGQPASDEAEIAFFAVGVRGCCGSDVDPKILRRIVATVGQGEPWIRRCLVPRLLDELAARSLAGGRSMTGTSQGSGLTPREQQIAALIRTGESKEDIARRLDITERTVRAHLSDIFKKLDIGGRLKLVFNLRGIA